MEALSNIEAMRKGSSSGNKKGAHERSTRVVQARQALAFADPRIWVRLLMSFYHVYAALEQQLRVHAKNPMIAGLLPVLEELARSTAFLKDIEYHMRCSRGEAHKPAGRLVAPALPGDPDHPVAKYVARIREVGASDPTLLIAYCDTMYMGILAGGSVLKRAMKVAMELDGDEGSAIFSFPDRKFHELRAARQGFRDGVDALVLSPAARQALCEEHASIFGRNDEIIREATSGAPLSSYLMLWASLARQVLKSSYMRGAFALLVALSLSHFLKKAGMASEEGAEK